MRIGDVTQSLILLEARMNAKGLLEFRKTVSGSVDAVYVLDDGTTVLGTQAMNTEESMDWVFDHLCWRDPRYPQYIKPDGDEPALPPRTNCPCDNCCTGKDQLAFALLSKEAIVRTIEKLHDAAVKERDLERLRLKKEKMLATVPDGIAISLHSNFVLIELSCVDTLSETEQCRAITNIFRWISDLVANCPNRWKAADGNNPYITVR